MSSLTVLYAPSQYIALYIINSLSIAYYGATGAGNAIIFHGAYFLCKSLDGQENGDKDQACPGDIKSSILYITITGAIIFPIQAYNLRKNVKWDMACLICPFSLVGLVVGAYFLLLGNVDVLAQGLGAFFFSMTLQMIYDDFNAKTDTNNNQDKEMNMSTSEVEADFESRIVPSLMWGVCCFNSVSKAIISSLI